MLLYVIVCYCMLLYVIVCYCMLQLKLDVFFNQFLKKISQKYHKNITKISKKNNKLK